MMMPEVSFPLNIITSETIKKCINVTTNNTNGTPTYNGSDFEIPPNSTVVSNGGALTEIVELTNFTN